MPELKLPPVAAAEIEATFPFAGSALAGHTHTPSGSQMMIASENWAGVKGSANTDSEGADGTTATNDDAVAAAAAVAAGAWTHGALTNPDVPRNVCITIENPTGGALDLFEGVMTFLVTGTSIEGSPLTENITFTLSPITKSVAAGAFRLKYGVKAFKTVTNITLDNVPANDFTIAAGLGSKILILNELATGTEDSVVYAWKAGTLYATSGKVDTTNRTINWGALSDGNAVVATILGLMQFGGMSISSDSAGTPAGTVTPT